MKIGNNLNSILINKNLRESIDKFNTASSYQSSEWGVNNYSDFEDIIPNISTKVIEYDVHQVKKSDISISNDIHKMENSIKSIRDMSIALKTSLIRMNQGYISDHDIKIEMNNIESLFKGIVYELNTTGQNGEYLFSGYASETKPIDIDILMNEKDDIKSDVPKYYKGSKDQFYYHIPDIKENIKTLNANDPGLREMLSSTASLINLSKQENDVSGMPLLRKCIQESIDITNTFINDNVSRYIADIGSLERSILNFHKRITDSMNVYKDIILADNDKRRLDNIAKVMHANQSIESSIEISKRMHNVCMKIINMFAK